MCVCVCLTHLYFFFLPRCLHEPNKCIWLHCIANAPVMHTCNRNITSHMLVLLKTNPNSLSHCDQLKTIFFPDCLEVFHRNLHSYSSQKSFKTKLLCQLDLQPSLIQRDSFPLFTKTPDFGSMCILRILIQRPSFCAPFLLRKNVPTPL